MVHINMRVFKVIALLVLGISAVQAQPASRLRAEHRQDDAGLILDSEETSSPRPNDDIYDQRQNGTENYSIHLDGLAIIVAPVEALLLAGGLNDLQVPTQKPTEKPLDKPLEKPLEKPQDDTEPLLIKPEIGGDKPMEIKRITHRGNLKLVSFLAPFLRSIGRVEGH